MSAAGDIELRKKRTQLRPGEAEDLTLRKGSRAPAGPGPVAAPRRPSRALVPLILLIVVVTGWAVTASWYAWSGQEAVQRLTEEQAELRAEHERYRRNINLRLAGAGAFQNLEQDGLAGQLADIVNRQVQLESRQQALVGLGDRLQGIVSAGKGEGSAPGGTAPPGGAVTPKPAGGTTSPEPPRAPGQRSALEPIAAPPAASVPPTARPRLPAAFARLTPREQFASINGGLTRLERGQIQVLTSFGNAVGAGIGVIKQAITEVGLKADLDKPAPAAVVVAPKGAKPEIRKAPPDTFDASFAKIEEGFGDLARWRVTADAVPFRAPLGFGGVTSNFGTRKDPFTGAAKMHSGMDFRSPTGTPILAGGHGKVITAGETGGYGNLVEVDHGNSVVTRYGHMSAINVTVGQAVAGGTTVLGLVGSTGRSTGPHLHYETRISGSAVDPGTFIKVGGNLYETPTKADDTDASEPAHD